MAIDGHTNRLMLIGQGNLHKKLSSNNYGQIEGHSEIIVYALVAVYTYSALTKWG